MEVRIDHIADVVRRQSERRELADDVLSLARANREERGDALAQATRRIRERLAADAGVENELALGVDDEPARHGHRDLRTRRLGGEEKAPVELERAATQG